MSDRVLGPGTETPPRLQVARDLVGGTDKGNCEELGNSLAIRELGFEINQGLIFEQFPVVPCEY